jgi:hypothetical protein
MVEQNKNLHLRDLQSFVFEEHKITPKFKRFVEKTVLRSLRLEGYKLDEKRDLVIQMVRNLITTGLAGAVVSDTRDWNAPGAKLRSKLWDLLVKAGYARMCKGSESSGKVSRYRVTRSLLRLKHFWRLRLLEDLHLARNTELTEPTSRALVVVHTGKIDLATGMPLVGSERKRPISLLKLLKQDKRIRRIPFTGTPDPEHVKEWIDSIAFYEDLIERINDSNASHKWRAYHVDEETTEKAYFEPNVKLRQIHVGELNRATRLYSFGHLSGQNLSKAVRRRITIDGEPAAELDFSGYATRMLYHLSRIDPEGDVYRPELVMPKFYAFENASDAKKTIVRDFVKKATNICWNVSSRSEANSAVGRQMVEYADDKFFSNIIHNVEQTTAAGIVQRIVDAHPKLAEKFFTEVGLGLMTTDGRIMLHMLVEFEQAKKPVLAIHDSLVVKASDAGFARRIMQKTYYKFLIFLPVINRVY